ncbi:MAG: sulfate permease [Cytophagales bacterium]|nr:sulfate permease [Cytophagales bacterium]
MTFLHKIFPITYWLTHYKKADLGNDLFAGITVGIMLIPQGMAYALIAGLPPVYGLYASIVPQLIYAIFGTSRQLSVAPVAMDSLLVATGVGVLATEGTDTYIGFAILLAFFMGAFQLLLGIFRMGFITNLLAKPVISGFTSAAAIIIGLNQLKYLLGTEIEKSSQFFQLVFNAFKQVDQTHLLTLLIGISGIIIIKGIKRINPRIPGALVAVTFGILLVYLMQWDREGVSIVESIPGGLPPFQFPNFSLGQFAQLIPLALTISIVAFMEAFSVAKAIESKRKDYKVVANQELIALGASNVIGSLFQTYPVTGGFSRSAVNHQAGANTPLSSMISAILVGLTLLFLTPLFYYLPHAILASIIMVAVGSLIDLRYARKLWKENKLEFALLLITFLVTLNFSMVPGIVSGVVASILLLLYRAAYPHIAELGRLPEQTEFRNIKRFNELETWEDKAILRVDAPLTFINIQFVKSYIEEVLIDRPEIKTLVMDASAISQVDASAIEELSVLLLDLRNQGKVLLLTDVVGPVRDTLFKTGLIDQIGTANIFLTLNDALEASSEKEYLRREDALQHEE